MLIRNLSDCNKLNSSYSRYTSKKHLTADAVNLCALEELRKMATGTFILFRGSKRISVREGDMNTGKTCMRHHRIFVYGRQK